MILEDPAFPNVHSLFKSIQANLLPIATDENGISIKKMNELNHLKPKLVHVTPSNHYPLGKKMSLQRRKELLDWASKNNSLIIENDYENEVGGGVVDLVRLQEGITNGAPVAHILHERFGIQPLSVPVLNGVNLGVQCVWL